MRTTLLLAAAAIAISAFPVAPAIAADGPDRSFSGEDLFNLQGATDPQISPDGSKIVYVRSSGDVMSDRFVPSIWLVDADSSYKLSLQKPRFGFFRDLINHALAGGALRKDVDVYVLGLMIVPMFSAAYQAWAGGWVSIEEFRARAKLGICIVLEGYADGPYQEKLRGLLPSLEADVRDQRQKFAGRRPLD